jgi:hypothetical protein
MDAPIPLRPSLAAADRAFLQKVQAVAEKHMIESIKAKTVTQASNCI